MSSPPLMGDASRDASASVAGYVYQAYQSLFAWLQLQPGEFLWLEGAEDIDLTRAGEARADQVRSSRDAGTISLGRADAREAIANFWKIAT